MTGIQVVHLHRTTSGTKSTLPPRHGRIAALTKPNNSQKRKWERGFHPLSVTLKKKQQYWMAGGGEGSSMGRDKRKKNQLNIWAVKKENGEEDPAGSLPRPPTSIKRSKARKG